MARLSRSGPLLFITGIVFVLLGLALLIGGIWLLALGGSGYYLIAGLGLVATGVLLGSGRTLALWLYALVLLGSTGWALYEVRLDWWQLLPRLDVWFVLALWLWLPFVNRRLGAVDAAHRAVPDGSLRGGRWAIGITVAIALLVGLVSLVRSPHDRPGQVSDARMNATGETAAPLTRPGDWTAYGHSGYGDRYSPARQITPQNVDKLTVAWTFHTGDLPGPADPREIANEVTPLKANGMLYLCTPHNIVIALNPDTGREIWRFDPRINRDAKGYQHMICRGVAYYDSGAYAAQAAAMGLPADRALAAAASAPTPAGAVAPTAIKVDTCPRRIFAPTADATIVAINADNGQPCRDFGDNGSIGLYHDQPMKKPGYLNPTSPPTVTRHVLIVGASVTDNASTDEPSGVIRGYDIDTGRLRWNWDPSEPDQTRPLPPGQTYIRNSPNAWSVFSVDEKLGLVYLPMGNQTPDIWGGRRDPQGEQYSSAIVALDIATGQVRWVYQTVHHDLWDMDIGGQPTLVDLDMPQGRVPALVTSTKRGDIYVLDRRDGHLLVPAPERPVPQGAARGDHVSPTQPFSALSFAPERALREADMWGTTPYDQLVCRIAFKRLRYQGIFTPPSVQGSLVYPGDYGIFDWGGIAIDPVRQVAILNPSYMAFVSRLYPREEARDMKGDGSEHGLQPMKGTPFAVDLSPLLSPFGVPCQAPPWGYLAAVDLTTMQKVWMYKNGTIEDQAPFGIPLPLGVPSLGGPMVTAGGVAFLSGTLDAYLRAYDMRTGDKLWQARLPAGGQATPMTYVSERTGRQYVVVMAGGHRSLGTKIGDALIAYALPKPSAK
ncbi:membrane-bound PQQ-dependent dehydrogenase, glucose/quinate/shikimate family [Frateuria sp. STR12]|uniref:membrane-bound PQQ-dependent dehydrogenase, glucose/quinate/shikimate family n=1 Tax=Frateuria hangzhouensis TaxID=2995589 RepID=UPI002260CE5F|nr:membrane-bound PQQ-dependent dehydrogenase, glucose/quinate/shikimate family [Frateuria sp. STR12]MCX7512290.1 membrane-bound PQQ-dependent dehydrogenase, glucose/quinate/shikimate family [Frateuria sp. STR12]